MNPYRNFDGEQLASRNVQGGTNKASEGYILGTGIATSAILPLSVLWLATILLNLYFHYFVTPRPARTIFLLGDACHVPSRHTMTGGSSREWTGRASSQRRGIKMQPWLFRGKRVEKRVLLDLKTKAQQAQQTTTKGKMVCTWKRLAKSDSNIASPITCEDGSKRRLLSCRATDTCHWNLPVKWGWNIYYAARPTFFSDYWGFDLSVSHILIQWLRERLDAI